MTSARVLSTFTLAMISLSAILNVRSLPAMASLGPEAVTFFALAALCFLIPSALVCAELATTLPKNGGIYTWVRTAFGNKVGFMAIWMEWGNNVIGFPTSLSAIIATIAYANLPALDQNKYVLFGLMLLILWACTAYNALGIKASSRLNIIGALCGIALPGVLIIGLGSYWLITHPDAYHTLKQQPLLPDWHIGNLAIFIGTLSAYSGMQITAFHAQNVLAPQRTFPRAILLTTVLVFGLSTLATLGITIVLPPNQVNFMNGMIESFALFFQHFHLTWLTPILAILLALGSVFSLSAWLIGPARGLNNACQQHPALRYFEKTNRFEMPYRILILQAVICTGLSAIFLFMPSLKSAFWVLVTLTSQFTVLMYVLVFAATIRLRYTHKTLERPFSMGPNGFVWIVCGVGILTCSIGFLLGLFPPSAIGIVHQLKYALFVLLGDAIIIAIPIVFLTLIDKKPTSVAPLKNNKKSQL